MIAFLFEFLQRLRFETLKQMKEFYKNNLVSFFDHGKLRGFEKSRFGRKCIRKENKNKKMCISFFQEQQITEL